MFDKIKFANILRKINETYENQVSFAKASDVNRTYLSQYMNMKLDSPPTPKILMGIANASKGLTTYYQLMNMCGYIIDEGITSVHQSLKDATKSSFFTVPIFISSNGTLLMTEKDVVLPFEWDRIHSYFGYEVQDDSMLPLLDVGDIAIIEKTDKYENGQTYLCSLDNKEILIRKLLDFKDYIELQTVFPYNKPLQITKDDIISRNFTILGKVVKAEINFK